MPPVKKPKHALQRIYLREWREYLNLSQEAAASRLNISRSLLSKVENGLSPYTQQLLENAAEAYGCEVADLIVRNPLQPNSVWSIADQLAKAPEEKQRRIMAVVETLLKSA